MIPINVTWFTPWTTDLGIIGLVKAKDEITEDIEYYIGVGRGVDIKEDIDTIMKWGAPVYPEHMNNFLKEEEK